MPREQLVSEARQAARAARHNLKWMDKHPDRYDEKKKKDMQQYLNMLIKFAKEDKKNTRFAERASVLSSVKGFVVSIVPHFARKVVAK